MNPTNPDFYSIDSPAPVKWLMGRGVPGSYDGIYLQTTGASKWRHQPNNVPLIDADVFVPMGHPLPLKHETIYTALPKDSMFYFARNVSSPACCPSTYSTNGGCVCTTEEQRRFINDGRGGNRANKSNGDY